MPKANEAELRKALGSGFPKHPLHKISRYVSPNLDQGQHPVSNC
jgi:hypothetical protein